MTSIVFTAEKFQIGAGLSGYVAEQISAFSCATLGIVPTVRHADYIGTWLEVMREDSRAIVRAASQASKAADWLLSFLPEDEQSDSEADRLIDRRAA
jgi:antirestriction protein ArdC